MNNVCVRPATRADVEGVSKLYEDVITRLEMTRNYPHWLRGTYPTHDDAMGAYGAGELYVAMVDCDLAGTMVLRHTPEDGYSQASWSSPDDYDRTIVVFTLAVAPTFLGRGVALALLGYAEGHARAEDDLAVRLDVAADNEPACRLYEKAGFSYVDTVSLGYEEYGLPWFRLYEKVL